jgi:predicted PolB exonuclease-like 3'-5' exonuclease
MHILDIETIALPDDQLAALKPVFEPPSNYKDPAKIADNLAAQEAKWREQAALSALTGRVAIIGLMDNLGTFVADVANEPGHEADILRNFWRDYGQHHVLGWNIKGFDIPFLVQRSWIHGIRVPDNVFNGRYISADWATDLLERWTCFQSRLQTGSSLDAVSRACGLGGKASTGAEFGKLWATDRMKAMDYCQSDCGLTLLLAKRLGAM